MSNTGIDFREYRNLIRACVNELAARDENWKWKVLAINKSEVRIGWGYLDYLGGGCFKLLMEDTSVEELGEVKGDEIMLRAVASSKEDSLREDFYSDFVRCKDLPFLVVSLQDAIMNGINAIGREAFTRY